MYLRSILISLWMLTLFFFAETRSRAQALAGPVDDLQKLLTRIAPKSPDPCQSPGIADQDDLKLEEAVFQQAATVFGETLNQDTVGTTQPRDTAAEVLKKLEALSDEVNSGWPVEDRLHLQLLDFQPIIVLKAAFGVQARFFVFGVPEKASDSNTRNRVWRQIGSDGISSEHASPRSWLDLYPLHRGPSGRARFLAAIGYSGCAGSSGLAYEAYDWDPSGTGTLSRSINQEGSVGMGEVFDGHKASSKDPFAPIGVLHTVGSTVTLPYCWFSTIDFWDNPSLCAVDTYDLSGDEISFRSRSYNRPDLVPIAKALEYAEKRDYPAVLGYCASSAVAESLVRKLPPFTFDEAKVVVLAKGRERVQFGDPPCLVFEVRKQTDRWVVVSLKAR